MVDVEELKEGSKAKKLRGSGVEETQVNPVTRG
jgi:hypothetical protein